MTSQFKMAASLRKMASPYYIDTIESGDSGTVCSSRACWLRQPSQKHQDIESMWVSSHQGDEIILFEVPELLSSWSERAHQWKHLKHD